MVFPGGLDHPPQLVQRYRCCSIANLFCTSGIHVHVCESRPTYEEGETEWAEESDVIKSITLASSFTVDCSSARVCSN